MMKKFKVNYSTLFLFIIISAFICGLMCGCGSSGGADDGISPDPDPDPNPVPTYNFTGTVYNENGIALPEVPITVFSDPKTYSTDSNGDFTLAVSETVHTLLVSGTGYSDIFKVVEIPTSGTRNQPVMLKDFPVTTSNVLAKSGKLLISNSIDNKIAKLDIPAQASKTFDVGSETGLSNADIGVEYIDVSMPLPVPLPSPNTLDADDVRMGEKEAPSVLVSVKPALLKMKTPATLTLPNPYDLLNTRILRFDPYTSKWKDTNVKTDDTPGDGTIVNVTEGGIYGIFYEESKTATVKGTAVPGSLVFVGDEVVKVTSSGTFNVKVPVPPDGSVDMSGFDPDTGRISTRRDQNIEQDKILTVNFLFGTEPAVFTIGRTLASVKSDNSDTSTITAVVMDEDRAPVEGAVVRFNASGGYISVATVTTDSEGKAETVFSAGTDRTNQLVEITAIIDGVPKLGSQVIHVQITGTEILLATDQTNLEQAELTIRVLDAATEPINNSEVTFSTLDPGTLVKDDNIRLNLATAEGYNNFYTDDDGVLKVTVTGIFNNISFDTLLMVESSGAKATQPYNVTSSGDEFKIIEVSKNGVPYDLNKDININTGDEIQLVVTAEGKDAVRFSATLGAWKSNSGKYEDKVLDAPVQDSDNTASAWFRSDIVGLSTIQVFDAANPQIMKLLNVSVSAPPEQAFRVVLQSDTSVVLINNATTLRATVRNDLGHAVGGASVVFSMENNAGDESISPVIVETDGNGVAVATFTAGSTPSSAQGVTLKAHIHNMESINDSTSVIIGGVVTSINISDPTKIANYEGAPETTYSLPMTIQVADASGGAVSGVKVSLSVWPFRYATGYRSDEPDCIAGWRGVFPNEDDTSSSDNHIRNLLLDEVRDEETGAVIFTEDKNGDGKLTPNNTAAGTVSLSVVETNEDGIANFNLLFPKSSAGWVEAEISASTVVQGTENQTIKRFWLGHMVGEECNLSHSPFNPTFGDRYPYYVIVNASPNSLTADGLKEAAIKAKVYDILANLVEDGTVVNFETTAGTLSSSSAETKDGIAEVKLTAPTYLGTATVTAKAKDVDDDDVSGSAIVAFMPGPPAKADIKADPSSITADGRSTSTIEVKVYDMYNNAVADGQTIIFDLQEGMGMLSSRSAVTSGGTVSVVYTSIETPGTVRISIASAVGPELGTVDITLRPTIPGGVSLKPGSSSIIANGTSNTVITATITDNEGQPVKDGTSVVFETTAGHLDSQGGSSEYNAITANGQAFVTLYSSTNTGTATITATAGGASNNTSVTFVPGPVHSIKLTADPESLIADGTTSSTIQAEVRDENGNAVTGETITFSTIQGTGKLTPTTATTGDGFASATFTPSSDSTGDTTVVIKAASTNNKSDTVNISVFAKGVAAKISIASSQATVKSDDSDYATITATVLDSKNAALEGITVSFKTEGGGKISKATVDTDENGNAEVTFSSGTGSDTRANGTVVITASVTNELKASIPVKITGTTITLTPDKTNLGRGILTVDVKDAGLRPVYNATVSLVCIDPVLSQEVENMITWSLHEDYEIQGYKTDLEGKLKIRLEGSTKKGRALIKVTAMNTSATQEYTVSSEGEVFEISAIMRDGEALDHTQDRVSMTTKQKLSITVSASKRNKVRFASILGEWEGSGGKKILDIDVGQDGTATATLISDEAGVATVQFSDVDDPSVSDLLEVVITAPVPDAAKIILQANPTTVAPSEGDSINTSVLTAKVVNSKDQVVGNAPVAFSIVENTISDETINPPIVYTDSSGIARSTFYSGSISSSAKGVIIQATVVNSDPVVESQEVPIIIGKTPTSVSITRGSVGQSINDGTAYSLPMAVMVTDANGSAIPNETVYLNAWPVRYAVGYWSGTSQVGREEYPNEDMNRNGLWDKTVEQDYNNDKQPTPPQSAAGSLPASVVTDENGVGTFELIYLKNTGTWVKDEITATTSASSSAMQFWLPVLVSDIPFLQDSPFNTDQRIVEITIVASPSTVTADGKTEASIRVEVLNANREYVDDNTKLTFETSAGTLDSYEGSTVDGVIKRTWTSPIYVGTGASVITGRYVDEDDNQEVTGTATIYLEPGPPHETHTRVKATPSNMVADGISTAIVEAVVFDENGNVVADGANIVFELQGQGILSSRTQPVSNGVASVVYTSPAITITETVTETVTVKKPDGTYLGFAKIILGDAVIGNVKVTPGAPDILADGKSKIQIRASVSDIDGAVVKDGTLVSFESTAGTIVETAVTANGIAATDLTSSRIVGTVTITATVGGVSGTTTVNFISGPVHKITLSADKDQLDADGTSTTTIRALVTDLYENAINGETITFSITKGSGRLSASTVVTDQGVATVTYIASLTPGTVEINAKATNGVNTAAPATISLAPTGLGKLAASADKSEIIVVLGNNTPGDANKTWITAVLRDSEGDSILGSPITFKDITDAGQVEPWPDDSIATGQDKGASPSFYTKGGNTTFIITNTAPFGQNIAVWLWNVGTGQRDLLLNTISPVTNEMRIESLDSGTYYLEVDAVDDWIIEVQGDVESVPEAEGIVLGIVDTKDHGEKEEDDNSKVKYTAKYEYTADKIAKVVTIKAESGDISSEEIIIKQKSGPPSQIELSAAPSEMYANGYKTSNITAIVRDINNNPAEDPVYFKLTEQSLENLKKESIPQTVIDGLESLKNKEYATQELFEDALTETIGDAQTVQYKSLVLEHTAVSIEVLFDADEGTFEGQTSYKLTDQSFEKLAQEGVPEDSVLDKTKSLINLVYDSKDNFEGALDTAIDDEKLFSEHIAAFLKHAGFIKITTDAGNAVATLTSPVRSSEDGNSVSRITGSITIPGTEKQETAATSVNLLGVSLADMMATPASVEPNGTDQSVITVRLKDTNGVAVVGERIDFFITDGSGTLKDQNNLTNEDGIATATFIAPSTTTDTDTTSIIAKFGLADDSPLDTTSVNVESGGIEVSHIVLTVDPSSIPADGKSKSTITAELSMTDGSEVPDDIEVKFDIRKENPDDLNEDVGQFGNSGSISTTSNTASGFARATITSGKVPKTVTVWVSVGENTATSEIDIDFTPGSISLIVVPSSVLGTGYDTSKVTAILTNADSEPVEEGNIVNFEIDNLNLGTIDKQKLTDTRGIAEAEFKAAAAGGTVTVTASWTLGESTISSSETITVQSPPGIISVTEGYPIPTTINIKGTGGQSTSRISFDVKDSDGNLVADGYRVDFSILSSPNGGEVIAPLFALTSDGKVSTVLRSGFKPGPVSIKAVYFFDSNVSTSSSQIAIVAGQPVGEEFGISAEYVNISGLWIAGLEDQIKVKIGDRHGNAIPDGTAISFKTYNTGGKFDPGTAPTSGVSAANTLFTSPNPKPMQGFVSLTAEAIGGRTTHVTCLEVIPQFPSDPEFSQIIYAGTDGGGVYKSLDSGATWKNISRSTESEHQGQNWIDPYINDIAVDPDNPNRVYAATGYLGQGRIYRSMDGGNNWNSNNPEEWNGIFGLPSAIETVLCDDDGTDGVDTGEKLISYYQPEIGDPDQWYKWIEDEAITIPADRYVWIGTKSYGAYYAEDGETFEQSSGLEVGDDVYDIVKVSGTNQGGAHLYAGTASGVYKSENGGATWEATSTFNGDTINTLALYPGLSGADIIYAGTEDSGIWVSYDGGTNWGPASIGLIGKGLSATLPVSSITNKGTGVMSEVKVFDDCKSEDWTITCQGPTEDYGTYFTIRGSISGLLQDKPYYFADTVTVPKPGNNTGNGTMKDLEVSHGSDDDFFSETWTVTCKEAEGGGGIFSVVRTNSAGSPDLVEYLDYDIKNMDYYKLTEKSLEMLKNEIPNDVVDKLEDLKDKGSDTQKDFENDLAVTLEEDQLDLYKSVILKYSKHGVGKYEIENVLEFRIEPGSTDFVEGDTFTFNTIRHDEIYNADNVPESKYSIDNVLEFTITDGAIPFEADDMFTFTTTRDEGRGIKDILVDPVNNLLYAITYFDGESEPHPVGNVYVHELGNDGYLMPGAWTEANMNLPQYDPPDDTTLFAQHVMAVNVPDNPTSLFIGGEGINFYKAVNGMNIGNPDWQPSLNGLENLIMARMPVLFSGECTMNIAIADINRGGSSIGGTGPIPLDTILKCYDVVTFHIYVQDINGNPPITGSNFSVDSIYPYSPPVTINRTKVLYEDDYASKGTFNDLSDWTTNIPIVSRVTADIATIKITFTPACSDNSPGCSGGVQVESFGPADCSGDD